MSTLQIIWFLLIALLLIGYTILDGFDLGVGFCSLFTSRDEERRSYLQAIGPFWDGNEVWLLTAGGALFAAFPAVYASLFSGFYLALMLVLAALILRAVSLEWRGREESPAARRRWDLAFGLGSSVATLLFGVAFGNIMRGVPLDVQGNYTGTFFTLLNPFALLIGVLNVALIATHGALYLSVKLRGESAVRANVLAHRTWYLLLPLALAAMIAAIAGQPHLLRNYQAMPALWVLPVAAFFAILGTGYWNFTGRARKAFAASSASIALLLGSAAAGLFPALVPSLGDATRNLTIVQSSSPLTLTVMLVVALVGMVAVAGYTLWVYRTFGGPIEDSGHY